MSGHAPEVEAFVEELVTDFLESLAKSKQYENRYKELPIQVKGATTTKLRRIARRATTKILENSTDLSELDDDSFIKDAIKSAIDDDN